MRAVGVTSGESGGHVLAGCACSFRHPGASAAADRFVPRRKRTEAPRERLRFFSNPTMPPERRSRTKPERRTGSRPNRKIRMKPDSKARAGPGGPPRKAAYSSQRKPPAGPRAAAAAITIAAAEESRLRELNRLTLEEDKPAVERCLEELVFGDVADNEDALLRRLRGPRVRGRGARGWARSGGARGGRRTSGGGAWATCGAGETQVGGSGRTRAPRGAWRKVPGGRRPRPSRGRGSRCAWCPAGAPHLFVRRPAVGSIFCGSAPRTLILRVPPAGSSDRPPPTPGGVSELRLGLRIRIRGHGPGNLRFDVSPNDFLSNVENDHVFV